MPNANTRHTTRRCTPPRGRKLCAAAASERPSAAAKRRHVAGRSAAAASPLPRSAGRGPSPGWGRGRRGRGPEKGWLEGGGEVEPPRYSILAKNSMVLLRVLHYNTRLFPFFCHAVTLEMYPKSILRFKTLLVESAAIRRASEPKYPYHPCLEEKGRIPMGPRDIRNTSQKCVSLLAGDLESGRIGIPARSRTSRSPATSIARASPLVKHRSLVGVAVHGVDAKRGSFA